MKKIFTLCGTLVAVTLLSTACSHSKKLNEEAAADSTLIPREGTTADPVNREHVAAVIPPRQVVTENKEAPRDTSKTTAAPATSTNEPTAALDDANLGASSSGRGR